MADFRTVPGFDELWRPAIGGRRGKPQAGLGRAGGGIESTGEGVMGRSARRPLSRSASAAQSPAASRTSSRPRSSAPSWSSNVSSPLREM